LNKNPGDFVITESWSKFCFCNVVQYKQHSSLYLQKNNSLSFEIQLQLWQNDVTCNEEGLGPTSIWFLFMKSRIQGQCQQAHHCDNQPTGTAPWPLHLLFLFTPEQHKHYLTITVLPSVCCMFYLTLNCFRCKAVSTT
jgi:hypothetical protein